MLWRLEMPGKRAAPIVLESNTVCGTGVRHHQYAFQWWRHDFWTINKYSSLPTRQPSQCFDPRFQVGRVLRHATAEAAQADAAVAAALSAALPASKEGGKQTYDCCVCVCPCGCLWSLWTITITVTIKYGRVMLCDFDLAANLKLRCIFTIFEMLCGVVDRYLSRDSGLSSKPGKQHRVMHYTRWTEQKIDPHWVLSNVQKTSSGT